MTSRVHKGGAIFRPVAKPRARATASQTPAPAESSTTQDAAISQPGTSSCSMPPPSAIPQKPDSPVQQPPQEDTYRPPPPIIRAAPSLAVSREAPVTLALTIPALARASSAVPSLARASSSVPSLARAPPRIARPASTSEIVVASQEDVEMDHASPPPAPQPESKKSAPRKRVHDDSSVKIPPKRRTAARKKHAVDTEEDQDAEGEEEENIMDGPTQVAESSSAPTRKSSRTRKSVVASQPHPVDDDEGDNDVVDADFAQDGVRKPNRKRKAPAKDAKGEDEDARGSAAPPEKKRARKAKPLREPKEKRPAAPRSRKKKVPSLPPYDPSAEPGEEIDPTVMTMAALCEDLGVGRVSSKAMQIQDNHAAWKANNRQKRALMKTKAEMKKYGRADEDEDGNHIVAPDDPPAPVLPVNAEAGPSNSRNAAAEEPEEVEEAEPVDPNAFDYTQNLATSRFNVQVRIGPNGETIIDEESLFVERDDEVNEEEYTHVEESDTTKFVNSGTYGKKLGGSRWSIVETELFYDALSQFGENYELISLIMPGRDRKSCKNKFKAEDKKDPERITQCLNNKTPYGKAFLNPLPLGPHLTDVLLSLDIATLSRLTGKDFSGPVPVIRALTPINLGDEDVEAAGAEAAAAVAVSAGPLKKSKRKSKKAELAMGEEVLGDADTFDPEFDKEE